ncbi:MAG: amidohydrolase [Chloroflexi bacterium]|nr:amidohydrolase [Chloroflexota bacterium]
MTIVDTHVHTLPTWREPIEAVLFHMNSSGVDKATLCQLTNQTDNRYILDAKRRNPGRFAPVVFVDFKSPEAPDTLRQLVKEGAEGIRLGTNSRSPGNDPLAIWRAAAELGIPVSAWGVEEEYASDDFRGLIKTLPEVTIIIEHLGYPKADEKPPYAVFQKILSLAEFKNTYIKVGGLGEFAKKPNNTASFRDPFPFDTVPPFVQMALKAFGASRMMWASNYSSCSYLEGYAHTLIYLREHLSHFSSEDDRQCIFGKTALSLYKFEQG